MREDNTMPDAKNTDAVKGPIEIRPAENDDISDMIEVWISAFGQGFHGGAEGCKQFLDWAIFKRPGYRAGEDWAYVAVRDGEIVAAWLSIPFQIKIAEHRYQARWLSSTAVAPKGQRQGLGRRLYRHIVSKPGITFGVGVVAASRALYTKEGADFVRADAFWERPTSIMRAFRECLHNLRHGRVRATTRLIGGILHRIAASALPQPTGFSMERVSAFTDDVEDLLSGMENEFSVMVPRTVDRLNWMIENPEWPSHALIARKDGDICGLAILRADGLILDFVTPPGDQEAAMGFLGCIGAWAGEMGIETLSGIVPFAYRKYFARSGFIARDDIDFGLFFAATGNRGLDVTLRDPEGWYLSMSDSDLHTFRAPPRKAET